jgi:hypothetical protein
MPDGSSSRPAQWRQLARRLTIASGYTEERRGSAGAGRDVGEETPQGLQSFEKQNGPADDPLIEAENLSEQAGPPHNDHFLAPRGLWCAVVGGCHSRNELHSLPILLTSVVRAPNLKIRTAIERRRIAPVTVSMSVPVRCSAPTISTSVRPRAVMAI